MRRALAALVLVALLASPVAALESRSFSRASAPHMPTLGAALVSLIPGSFHLSHQNGAVVIEAASWSGVNLTNVQAAVDAAPADTPAFRAKYEKDKVRDLYLCVLRAVVLIVFDENNVLRANIAASSLAARTLGQLDAALDNKIDALGCGE